jgi:tetratricopeptide (TPR) repeat protein
MNDSADRPGSLRAARVSFEELMTKGVDLFYRERERDAVDYLRSALEQQPNDLRARYLIALAAQLHSDEATVEQMSLDAQAIDPQNAYTLACLAVRFMDYANYSRADEYFEQALIKIPNDVDFWFGRGMLYDYAGDPNKAVNAYLRVVTLDPANVGAHVALGHAYADAGDFEAAFRAYSRARELDPESDNPHYRLGRDLLYRGALVPALQEMHLAKEEEPDRPGPYFFLLSAYRGNGRIDEAIDIYRQVRTRFQDRPRDSAEMFYQIDAFEDAIRDYRRALARDPEDFDSRHALASCYRSLGRWEDALAEFELLLEADPQDPFIRRSLAEARFRLGRFVDAARDAGLLIERDEFDFTAYDILANSLVMQGRTEEAARIQERQEQLRGKAASEFQRKFFGGQPTPHPGPRPGRI